MLLLLLLQVQVQVQVLPQAAVVVEGVVVVPAGPPSGV